jgi:hypothetical protein
MPRSASGDGRRTTVSTVTQDVWSLYDDLSATDPASLTDSQRRLVAVLDLRQEVNAGGFDSYFRAWGGNSAPEAIDALPGALGQAWATLLHDAMQVVGSPYPHDDPDERAARLDANAASDVTLAALDERLYDLEAAEDVDARLSDLLGRE